MADNIAETDQIEADIARTRARMDDRLDQLQHRFSPKQMANDAFAFFREGDGADMTQRLLARARANPMPLALVGVGVVWLMASNASTSAPSVSDGGHDLPPAASGIAVGRIDHPKQTEPTLKQEAQPMARSLRDTLSSFASNPFALGAVAAIVGATAGALIPSFEQEETALGAAATKIREKGRDLAQGVVDTGSRVASDTLDAVKESAGSHGLSADMQVGDVVAALKNGDLVDDAKAVAQETLQAGQNSALHHLAPQGERGTKSTDL
jgi:hypothetical protein